MQRNLTMDEVTAAVGDRIHRGEVKPYLGHSTIGAYAAWAYAAERGREVAAGGPVGEVTPTSLYEIAGTREELEAFGAVLESAGLTPPWHCPSCDAHVGQRHTADCDVSRCPACGVQATGCDEHPEAGTQTWTGRWPGEVEVEEGLARDLNDLTVKGARGELVWDPAGERYNRPS